MGNYIVEDILPHRDRMKLIDEIISVTNNYAETASLVQENWPLTDKGYVQPFISIELTAQTGGIIIGVKAMEKSMERANDKGWIVGIKKAEFFVDKIPVNSRLTCKATQSLEHDLYSILHGEVFHDEEKVGDVLLQVMRAG